MISSLYPISIVKILEITERIMKGRSSVSSRVYNPAPSPSAPSSYVYVISDSYLSKFHSDECTGGSKTAIDITFQC